MIILIPVTAGELEYEGIYNFDFNPVWILESEKEYLAIIKIDKTSDPTNHSVVVGYAFHRDNQILKPPMGENITEAWKFMEKLKEHQQIFRETSTLKDSKNIAIFQDKLPLFVNFTFALDQSGLYTKQLYYYFVQNENERGTSSSPFIVVKNYSKAFEDGKCKTKDFVSVIKHDYSTVACTSSETFHELRHRGWAISKNLD